MTSSISTVDGTPNPWEKLYCVEICLSKDLGFYFHSSLIYQRPLYCMVYTIFFFITDFCREQS